MLRNLLHTFVFAGLALIAATASLAVDDPPASTIELWQWDTDQIEKQLPQWETPEERARYGNIPPEQNLRSDPPPMAPIRNCAEFEPMTMALIRYPLGIPYALIREMDEDLQIACVVSSSSYNTARTNFQSNGIDPDGVDWIIAASDSYWTRDYGPWFVYNASGDIAIIDHYYNRPYRPNDNVIPIVCGQHWSIPVHTHDLWTTGGNYMTDGFGISFSTDLVWNENGGMTHQQIFDLMHSYYGLNTYNVVPDISTAGIHHIDCWAKLLDEETILMKQVASNHGDYPELEQNATLIASLPASTGRNYRVVRVYCQSIGGSDVASYTNSIILNDKVLVPTFSNTTYDNQALNAYRAAMPGYEVLGFTGSWLTDDAIHCRVMGIPDRYMLRVEHTPVREWHTYEPITIEAKVDDRSETGLAPGAPICYWRAYSTGNPPPVFETILMTPTELPDQYAATIPAQGHGRTVDYYIHAADNSGRTAGMPRSEPAGWYSFNVTLPAADAADLVTGTARLNQNNPNPFNPSTTFSFELLYADHVNLAIYDPQGRLVRTLLDGTVAGGRHEIVWDGRGDRGEELPAGTYFYRMRAAGVNYSRKAILAK